MLGTKCAVAAVVAVLCVTGAEDRLLGLWVYNPAQSTPSAGIAANQSIVRRHESVDNGLRITREIVDESGRTTHTEYVLKFDGRPYPPVWPQTSKTTWALSRLDDTTIRVEIRYENGNVLRQAITVSNDGRQLMVTETGQDSAGRMRSHTSVFDRR